MSDIVTIIISGGFGDALLGIQCASYIQQSGKYCRILASVRPEIFAALKAITEETEFYIEHIDERYTKNNDILKDEKLLAEIIQPGSEFYYVIPDLLYNNKYAFDYAKYGVSIQNINKAQIFRKQWNPTKMVYLGLNSNTKNYSYSQIGKLATTLAEKLPDYKFYLPIVKEWAAKPVPPVILPDILPDNLIIDAEPNFIENLKIMRECCYAICLDNGPSHYFHNLNCPRILLDPYFYGGEPWKTRWRENLAESVPIQIGIDHLVNIVINNLTVPQTQILPRMDCIYMKNWTETLLLKTF